MLFYSLGHLGQLQFSVLVRVEHLQLKKNTKPKLLITRLYAHIACTVPIRVFANYATTEDCSPYREKTKVHFNGVQYNKIRDTRCSDEKKNRFSTYHCVGVLDEFVFGHVVDLFRFFQQISQKILKSYPYYTLKYCTAKPLYSTKISVQRTYTCVLQCKEP